MQTTIMVEKVLITFFYPRNMADILMKVYIYHRTLFHPQSNTAVHHIEYHIRLNLFDVAYRRFIGHTWKSKPVATTRSELVTQPARINFKQVG